MSILDDMFQTYGAPAVGHWFGVTVKLKRGPRETPDVPANWSRQPDDIDLEFVPTKITERIYRIAVAAYVIGGEAVEPRRSDRIIETINGVVTTFEVLPNERMPAFQLEGDGVHWIIRAKRV